VAGEPGRLSRRRRFVVAVSTAALIGAFVAVAAVAQAPDQTDPARNVALPCEVVGSAAAQAPRAVENFVHLANVCEFVATDVEFQSRKTTDGKVHDYAFAGTMGGGFRIFDVTDPTQPVQVGGYVDPGWENDVQVRGNVVVATFDGVDGEDSSGSTCLKTRYPDSQGQGVDIYRLDFNAATGQFQVALATCVADPPGGAHNSTLSPDGAWLAISNCCSDWAIDVVDLRKISTGKATLRYRLIDENTADTARCPTGAAFKCVVMKRPNGSSASGLWRPHDVFFSKDRDTIYVAAINSTWIVDIHDVLSGKVNTIAVIPNNIEPGGAGNVHNVTISHQADTTADGKILIISDERGGGLTETGCNTGAGGVIGGLHFFALKELSGVPQSKGASPANPKKLGDYFTPNPLMSSDPLQPFLDVAPRVERACTIHVFRPGGNGSASPGAIQGGYGGVSGLGPRELTSAHYGAGTWHIDISGPASSTDGVAEDPKTTWGNTLGWIVMPGADTWASKEYKGHIYATDMVRGLDVFRFADCSGPACTTVSAPG
jgi:hypothetical protein